MISARIITVGSAEPLALDFGEAEVVTNDGEHNAFPSCCVADNGDLVISYRKATGHGATDGEIYVRRSDDQGETWEAEQLVLTSATYDYHVAGLTTLASGRIVMQAGRRLKTGPTDNTDGAVWLYSDDDGATWSSPAAITHGFTAWVREGGRIFELPNGDLLAPLYGQDSGDTGLNWRIKVSRSTDDGATWSHLAQVVGATQQWSEPGIVQLAGGKLLCLIRYASAAIYVSESTDDGATWSTPSLLKDNVEGLQAPLRLVDGRVASLVRNEGFVGARFMLGSADGATWTLPHTFEDSPAGNWTVYGSIAQFANRRLVAVYATEDPGDPPVGDGDIMIARTA